MSDDNTATPNLDDADERQTTEELRSDPRARDKASTAERDADPPLYARVEWVRPTELAQRAGSKVLEQGVIAHRQLRAALTDVRRSGGDYLRQALAERALAVQPDAPAVTSDRAVRRDGVGR